MDLGVLVVVVVLGSLASAQDNQTTLGEVFLQQHHQHLQELLSINELKPYPGAGNFSSWKPSRKLTLAMEVVNYTKTFASSVALELSSDWGNVTVQSLYKAVNRSCFVTIDDLRFPLENTTCVESVLQEMVTSKMKHAIDVVLLQTTSRDCTNTLCSSDRRQCIRAYERSVGPLLTTHAPYLRLKSPETLTTPLDILEALVLNNAKLVNDIFSVNRILFLLDKNYKFSERSIEPFEFENIINAWDNNIILGEVDGMYLVSYSEKHSMSSDQLTWGVIRSNVGTVHKICSNFSEDYFLYIEGKEVCYITNIFRSYLALLSCAFKDSTATPLKWLPDHNIYFNSPCLCVAFSGGNCSVNPPTGVSLHTYCLSVLFRDLQRRITYRPALTYLDYAFQTRIPLCNFTTILSLSYWNNCNVSLTFDSVRSVLCHFQGLVDKDLNCNETLPVTTYNDTVLCSFLYFVDLVHCDDGINKAFNVSYYTAGNSTLVLGLTYADVTSRLLTLVSYLICPPLRNIPGKLMICYLMTTLIKLVVVNNILYDLQWAVRLDVFMDMSSTFWLTAYLHFLTTSIRTLRLPDSLSPAEARQVLITSALFGWVLPAALSAAFFCMDELLDSRIQFGQLLFVVLHYAALVANLFMFSYNCRFYYDVISIASDLQLGANERNVLASLFNFALKTSVLSGAGITLRLVLTQIPGLEHLLGYSHALGTLQGLLLFVLYGCNREARVFWVHVFHRMASHFNFRKTSSLRLSSTELAEIPVGGSLQSSSSSL